MDRMSNRQTELLKDGRKKGQADDGGKETVCPVESKHLEIRMKGIDKMYKMKSHLTNINKYKIIVN
jgi:hypothetical protein